MAEAQMVDPHDVVMTGENSFIRLSDDGGKNIAERVIEATYVMGTKSVP